MSITQLIFVCLFSCVSLFALFCFLSCFFDTKWNQFTDSFQPYSKYRSTNPRHKKAKSFFVIFSALGSIIFTGGGIYLALIFLPEDFGFLDEYDDWTSYRKTLSTIPGLLIGLFIMERLSKIWNTIEQQKIDGLLSDIAKSKLSREEIAQYCQDKITTKVFRSFDSEEEKTEFYSSATKLEEILETRDFFYLSKASQNEIKNYLRIFNSYSSGQLNK